MLRSALIFLLCCALPLELGSGALAAEQPVLRILVLGNVPPMSFRNESGQLTGFSVEIARAICSEMQVNCSFNPIAQHALIDALSQGQADISAVGLLATPERRAKILFSDPYYRSMSLWIAGPGVKPGRSDIKVAVVAGSAQEAYGRRAGWNLLLLTTHGELGGAVLSGSAQATLVPMISGLNLQKDNAFRQLGLATTVLQAPGLSGDACLGISPFRPELQKEINAALERIKRNGTYDRINSRFLPFRVS